MRCARTRARPLVAGLLAAVAGLAPAAASAAPCEPVWQTIPTIDQRSLLVDVSMVSRDEGWAVGNTSAPGRLDALILHWDGRSWTRVPGPQPGQGAHIDAVDALAPDDVWAAGYFFTPSPSGGRFNPWVLHWDGVSWTTVEEPAGQDDLLRDILAIAPDDVWAVGSVVEHWDGETWSIVPEPTSGFNNIDAASATDLWAVGTGPYHSTGGPFTRFPSPQPGSAFNFLEDVDVIASDDVWAVGAFADQKGENEGPHKALAIHWDGSTWSRVSVPGIAPGRSLDLQSVGAAGPGDVWITGNEQFESELYVVHFNGERWTRVATPPGNALIDIDVLPDGSVVAAGYRQAEGGTRALIQRMCPILVSESGLAPKVARAGAGKHVFWHVDNEAPRAHALRDNSGLGLFSSRPVPPGHAFRFAYPSAGTFAVLDRTTGATAEVRVPVGLSPTSGGTSTAFTIRWAPRALPAGLVADVQLRRPGASGFTDWQTGRTDDAATFLPDAGPGEYAVRARLRRPATGAASDWSSARVFQVSP